MRFLEFLPSPYPNELYIVLSNLLFHDGENFVPQSSVEIGMMVDKHVWPQIQQRN